MSEGMVERVARAIRDKAPHQKVGAIRRPAWSELGPVSREPWLAQARAAIQASRYEDDDEAACLIAEHRTGLHGAIVAETHDALIDAVLKDALIDAALAEDWET